MSRTHQHRSAPRTETICCLQAGATMTIEPRDPRVRQLPRRVRPQDALHRGARVGPLDGADVDRSTVGGGPSPDAVAQKRGMVVYPVRARTPADEASVPTTPARARSSARCSKCHHSSTSSIFTDPSAGARSGVAVGAARARASPAATRAQLLPGHAAAVSAGCRSSPLLSSVSTKKTGDARVDVTAQGRRRLLMSRSRHQDASTISSRRSTQPS